MRVIIWSPEEELGALSAMGQEVSKRQNTLVEVLSQKAALDSLLSIATRDSAQESRLVLINGHLGLKEDRIEEIISGAQESASDFGTYSFSDGNSSISSRELELDTLVANIDPFTTWSLAAVYVRESLIEDLGTPNSCEEALARIGCHALAGHANIDWNVKAISVDQGLSAFETQFSKQTCSNLLQFAINLANVEELFPNHAWELHEEESAAACYHTLAARFLSYDDLDTAKQCLQFGDRFEDSPRSLALKGLMALKEGETLSAVANMVSSLQEYEKRKDNKEEHYLSFQPKNIEQINTSLQSGLTALNSRDNDQAAECFRAAVFEFDSFYQDCGLTIQ